MARRLYTTPQDQQKALAMIKLYDEQRKHRTTFKADDRLSRAISKITRLISHTAQAADDIALYYAPSECYTDLYKGLARKISEALIEFDYTADDLIAEATERTNARFVYMLGLGNILDFAEPEISHD